MLIPSRTECLAEDVTLPNYSTVYSDIWALGLILANMISGRRPWAKAAVTDKSFRKFLGDPDFLYNTMPISRAASDLICRMLGLFPPSRIPLADVREEIRHIPTFFRPDDATCAPHNPPTLPTDAPAFAFNEGNTAHRALGPSEATEGAEPVSVVDDRALVTSSESSGLATPDRSAEQPVDSTDMPTPKPLTTGAFVTNITHFQPRAMDAQVVLDAMGRLNLS